MTVNELAMRAASKVLGYGTRLYDPLIRYRLNGHVIELPLSHQLPWHRRIYPNLNRNLQSVTNAVALKYPARPIIDIGANVGDSAILMRQSCQNPILCIEGSPKYFAVLERNLANVPNVSMLCSIVAGFKTDNTQIETKGGTGVVRRGVGENVSKTLQDILVEHPQFLSSKLLKIDTDGFDGQIIIGALSWIKHARPAVFWELDLGADKECDGPGESIIKSLMNVGYESAVVYDHIGNYVCGMLLPDSASQLIDLARYANNEHTPIYFLDVCLLHAEDVDVFHSLTKSGISRDRIISI